MLSAVTEDTNSPIAHEMAGVDLNDDITSAMLMDCDDFTRELENVVCPNMNSIPPQLSSRTSNITDFRESMAIYYDKFFPLKPLLRWLSYGKERNYLNHREFSFTLPNDIYIRYLSFDNLHQFKAKLIKDVPVKIDIGAVYNSRPTERKTIAGANFRPLEHELVFDIDMTDYNDVRTCCQGKSVCSKCWRFLTVAIKILNSSLREDFGFENILWVFSGRRGVHCWVADNRARQLSLSARRSIVSYLELVKGSSDNKKKVLLPMELPTSIERALEIVNSEFLNVLEEQNILATKEARSTFLTNYIGDERIRGQIAEMWNDSKVIAVATTQDYWEMFTKFAQQSSSGALYLDRLPFEIQLALMYPRLDSNVSVQMNHLLKSPFCVHPDTGKICVPIDPTQAEFFDPDKVPTVQAIVSSNTDNDMLSSAFQLFEIFLDGLENNRNREILKTRNSSEKSLEF